MVVGLVACGAKEEAAPVVEEGALVGVAMPTQDLQRWNQDGANMKEQLEAAGYQVDLQYAANDIPTQVSQLQNMIASGCRIYSFCSQMTFSGASSTQSSSHSW